MTKNRSTKKKIKTLVKLIENTNPDFQVITKGLMHRDNREVNDKTAVNNLPESYFKIKFFVCI